MRSTADTVRMYEATKSSRAAARRVRKGQEEVHELDVLRVRAGQLERRGRVTEVVVNDVAAAEPELGFLQGQGDDGEEPNHPADHHQLHTDWPVHDGRVVQRTADGHVATEGHDCEDEEVGGAQGEGKERPDQAFSQGHGSGSGRQVGQHPRDHSGGDQHLNEGEVAERKQYMGEWRRESRHVRVTMARFPSTVSTYINRMKANRRVWNSCR